MRSIGLLLTTSLACALLAGCRPPEVPPATGDIEQAGDVVTFRARLSIEGDFPLPADARIAVYVLEADYGQGTRRVIAEAGQPAAVEYPVDVPVDVARELLDPERGYEVVATIVSSEGQALFTMPANRPPVPALGLYEDSVFPIVLRPVITPAPPEMVYRLTAPLELACADLRAIVRQTVDGVVVAKLPDRELRLMPAAATSGGRFSDGANELWFTPGGEIFLILRGAEPQPCVNRAPAG